MGKGAGMGMFLFWGEMGERGEREDGGVRMREQTQKLKELPIIKLPPFKLLPITKLLPIPAKAGISRFLVRATPALN